MEDLEAIKRIDEIQKRASECLLAWSASNVFAYELARWKKELKQKIKELGK